MSPGFAVKWTETSVLDLLRQRFVKTGNGGAGEYAFMTHVRNDAAFNANRTFDAVVLSLWPSRGLELHAYEVKVSRSDWLRELKEPAKAEAAAKLVDRFSVVVSDPDIVKAGELPPTWGLLCIRGSKLSVVLEAPRLREAPSSRYHEPVPRGFVVAMLRAGGAVPQADASEVRRAREEALSSAEQRFRETLKARSTELEALRQAVRDFEGESGLRTGILGGSRLDTGRDPRELAKAVRLVLEGSDAELTAGRRVEAAVSALRRGIDELEALLPAKVDA